MAGDRVEDNEVLFRRVEHGGQGYHVTATGEARISSQAFADRKREPSVDRASLCEGPDFTRGDPENGVVRLLTLDVRQINSVQQTDHKGNAEFIYKFDVIPVPLDSNPAHAEIHPSPEYRSKGRFKRLLEQLAILAEWEILPADAR